MYFLFAIYYFKFWSICFFSSCLFFKEREKDIMQPGREVGRNWEKLWGGKNCDQNRLYEKFCFFNKLKKTCLPNPNKLYKSIHLSTYLRTLVIFKLLTANSSQVRIPRTSLSSILILISKNETEIELYSHIFCFVLSGALRKSPKVMLSVDQSGHHEPALFHNSENSDNSDQ